jgi:hypothetical protein
MIVQHFRKDGEWWEAEYETEPRPERDGGVVYRKIHQSEKPCECIRKEE